MTPDEYCATRMENSNLYYGSVFLPAGSRRAINALATVAREITDVVDECRDPGVALTKFSWWRDELLGTWSGSARHPATQALLPFIEPLSLSHERLRSLLDACAANAGRVRYIDSAALHRCAASSGTALYSLPARAFAAGVAVPFAESLDVALRVTDMIAGVGQDLRQDRLYLPLDDLRRFDTSESDILARRHTPAFERLMAFQTARAHELYDRAQALLADNDRPAHLPGLILMQLGRALLDEIARDRYPILHQRLILTPLRKWWIAWKTRSHERRRTRRAA